jgi:hypothetical protein
VGKAQRLGNTAAVIAPPFGDGAIAAIATQHRTTGQREYSGQGMAFAPMAAKVWNLGEDLDEGLRLCYHDGPPAERVLVHVRCAGKARPHVEQNPVTHCRLVMQPHVRKLNDPDESEPRVDTPCLAAGRVPGRVERTPPMVRRVLCWRLLPVARQHRRSRARGGCAGSPPPQRAWLHRAGRHTASQRTEPQGLLLLERRPWLCYDASTPVQPSGAAGDDRGGPMHVMAADHQQRPGRTRGAPLRLPTWVPIRHQARRAVLEHGYSAKESRRCLRRRQARVLQALHPRVVRKGHASRSARGGRCAVSGQTRPRTRTPDRKGEP